MLSPTEGHETTAEARNLDYDTVDLLRRKHPAWRLLRADHAPLVVSFLARVFIQPNVRTVAHGELCSRLDDHLFDLRARFGEALFPRPSAEYLDAWADDDSNWLRKYYTPDSDEPYFDLTPATEKAIEWLAGLRQRQFVATESRLLTVFELLRQILAGTERDPAARLGELTRRRAEIDAEIARISRGEIALLDDTQVRDRFVQMASTARGLLADFREVEQNFRELDRGVRERIALWEGSKGQLLEQIFGDRDVINDSDQGRSFLAFWDFPMTPQRQEELSALLEGVFALPPVQALAAEPRLLRVHYDWLEVGEVAQRTVARLSQQLRRYLDDQVLLENRRIMQMMREIEQGALTLRDGALPDGTFMEIDDTAPDVALDMDRPLFVPPIKPRIDARVSLDGGQDVPADALYDQVYVDKARLANNVRRALQTRSQISLAEIVEACPLEQGLAELIAYFGLATEDHRSVIDDGDRQHLVWTDAEGRQRQATLPLIVFHR